MLWGCHVGGCCWEDVPSVFTLQSAVLGVDPSVLCALGGGDSMRVGGLEDQTRYLLGFFCLHGGAEAGYNVTENACPRACGAHPSSRQEKPNQTAKVPALLSTILLAMSVDSGYGEIPW